MSKKGLYANIHAKRERIKRGSGERMRKPGSKGAPTEQDFKDAAKTVKEGADMLEKRMSDGMSVSDIAKKHGVDVKAIELQIEKGIKVEKEHTDSEEEAKIIAMDHLVEIPDYYDRLLAMEKEAKGGLQEKARDYNAKAMWGKVKAQTFKAKKGKGSFSRKPKHKKMYESTVLTEGASNFSSMEHFPLLVWMNWETKVDEWMDEARQLVEEEYADSFNDMMEDEIEQLVQEKFEEISDESSKDIAILTEDEYHDLESEKDEFNSKFISTFDYDEDVVTIEFGYYEGIQLYVPNEKYLTEEQKAMIEEFLYTVKEKYYLTELGGSGAYGMGYTNKGQGQGLNQVELISDGDKDGDLEEDFVPPSEERLESFLKVLRDLGFTIDRTERWDDYGQDEIGSNVHIQITSVEKGFTTETFETKMEEVDKAIFDFDPERKNSITYSFDLMSNNSITAGLDMRPEWVDPKEMVELDEESKKNWGKPGKDYLKKLAKKHKKTDKKGARGWFIALGSGDVQRNINRFNSRMPGDSAPSATSKAITSAAGYTAPSSSGGSMAVSATAAGGLGEAMETGYALTEKIEKHDVLNPNLWEGNKLRPQVREKILDIVDLFIEGLRENNIRIMVKDIVIIGSNASYNYSDTSDVDVHLVVDTNDFNCPDNLYPFLYSSYRSIFNKKYDIEFYGTGVEIFVDMEDTPTVSNGIYSLNTGWIKEPIKEEIPEIDMEKFNSEFSKWEDKYFDLIKGEEEEVATAEKPIEDVLEESLESDKIDAIDDFIEDVYDLRKVSLHKDGEYSIGNLVFKELRSLGYLDNLKVLKNKLKSQELSLTEEKITEEKGTNLIDTLDEVARLVKIAKEDGTYIVNSKGEVEKQDLISGFQVSFFRPEITDSDIKAVLNAIGNTFGQQYLGVYKGDGELSYTLESSMAKEVARIFNQESIWENEKGKNGYTGNEFFDKTKKVDYKKAVEELLVLLGKKGEVK